MKLIMARNRKVGFMTLPLAKYADEKSVNDKGSAFAACKTLWSNKSTNVLPEKKLLTLIEKLISWIILVIKYLSGA